MRQTISGLFAAFAVLFAGAAPAMACGYYGPCQTYYAPVYAAPTYVFSPIGCNTCGTGWGYEQLADPETQYYYVNQGPTYTGPGAYGPYPVYHESAIGWAGYERAPSYYGGGYATPSYYGYRHHVWHGYRPYRYAYRPYYGHHYRRYY